jgi:hypothetical protein
MNMDETMNVRANSGSEVDAFGKHKRAFNWRSGVRKGIKTGYNRRNRKAAKVNLKEVEF